MSWERLKRTTVVDTPFLKVYSDEIRLPNGSLIDDYTVIEKRDVVLVVATDADDRVLTQREYRYAVDQILPSLPAGVIDKSETPLAAAKRELLEETGYGGGAFELVDVLYEYPTKDIHTITVVRAKGVTKQQAPQYEETEEIGELQLITIPELVQQLKEGKWKTTAIVAAFVRALPEILI